MVTYCNASAVVGAFFSIGGFFMDGLDTLDVMIELAKTKAYQKERKNYRMNVYNMDHLSVRTQIEMLEEERKNIDNQINLLKKVLKASLAQAQRELENEL